MQLFRSQSISLLLLVKIVRSQTLDPCQCFIIHISPCSGHLGVTVALEVTGRLASQLERCAWSHETFQLHMFEELCIDCPRASLMSSKLMLFDTLSCQTKQANAFSSPYSVVSVKWTAMIARYSSAQSLYPVVTLPLSCNKMNAVNEEIYFGAGRFMQKIRQHELLRPNQPIPNTGGNFDLRNVLKS